MEIIAGEPEWTDVDADHLRQFLATQSGQRLIPRIAHFRPGLLPKGDSNEILIRTGEVRGWQEVLTHIITMTRPEPKETGAAAGDNYPNLLDDTKWDDGQKLEQPASPTQPTQ